MRLILILAFCVVLSIPTSGFSQLVFKCTEESGTIVFSDKPCATVPEVLYIQDTNGGIQSSEHYYPEGRTGLNYSEAYGQRSNATGQSSSASEDEEAIKSLQREQKNRCGSKYWGKPEGSLLRSADIAKSQSESESKKNDSAEIGCHLRTIATIERIRSHGLEYALEYDRREASERQSRIAAQNESERQSRIAAQNISTPQPVLPAQQQPPGWLIDPYTGNAMPRTGAGYTDPMTSKFYLDTGAGVVDTTTSEFIPTHQ